MFVINLCLAWCHVCAMSYVNEAKFYYMAKLLCRQSDRILKLWSTVTKGNHIESAHLKLRVLVDGQADNIISVFKIEWLYSISCAQNNSRPSSMVHNISLGEVVQVVPGVESSITVNEFQTEFLWIGIETICIRTISKIVRDNMEISG